jgi:hypothetical protein
MAYAKDDPRSALGSATATTTAPTDDGIAAPEFLDFSLLPPDHVTEQGSRQWIVRGQNVVLIYTLPVPGDTIWKAALSTEQVVLLPEAHSAVLGASPDGEKLEASDLTLVVVPPGDSELVSTGSGPVVQLIETTETAWSERASNAAGYAQPHPRVALLDPWPEPVGGYRWRQYRMADVPEASGRFGRLFRTRSFMVNFFKPQMGPRDLRKMSPHFHDDFEQLSLVVDGSYIHHIQTPWGVDGTQWRPDDHGRVGSPSVTVIPPPTVHTSEAIGWDRNYLIDIFAGPRADFSAQPGWVLNADDYPSPA